MAKYKIKRKLYTVWDETDNLKRMKDSDILAEKEKPTTRYGDIAMNTVGGALAGAGVGTLIGGGRHLFNFGQGYWNRLGNSIKKGSKRGLIAGALLAGGYTWKMGRKQAKENSFYNDRLKYAKMQALRRERQDWRTNMTQRDGYSY
jgi:hypothetical protein